MVSGWIISDEISKLNKLKDHLIRTKKALGCSVSPAMSLYITHGSLLKESTLRLIAVKTEYITASSMIIEPQKMFVFFLKKREDKINMITDKVKIESI